MARSKRSRMRDGVKRQTERDLQGDSSNIISAGESGFFSVSKKGTKILDIIPYLVSIDNHPQMNKGDLWYKRIYFMHGNIGPNNDRVACPLKTIGKPCPICDYRSEILDKAQKAGKGQDGDKLREQAKALKPKRRELYNVIDIEEDEDAVKVWDVSAFLFGDLLAEELTNGPEENYDFAELEDGKSLRIRFKEDSYNNNPFYKTSRIDFIDREGDYKESIIEDAIDLDKAVNILSHKEIYQLFHGLSNEDLDDSSDLEPFGDQDAGGSTEEKAEAPPTSTRKKKKEEPEPEPEPEPIECEFDGYVFGENYDEEDADCQACENKEACGAVAAIPEASSRGDKKPSGKCPSDHEFGKDNDKHDECDNCDTNGGDWGACHEAKKALKKKGKK